MRLLVLPLGDVAAHGDRPLGAAELVGQRAQLVLRAGGEHEAVAGLGGRARGGGADAARGAGDEQDGVVGRGHGLRCMRSGPDAPRSREDPRPGRRRRRRLPVVPPRGPRAQGRPRRRRRRPRGRRRAASATTTCATSQAFRRRAHFKADRGGHGQGDAAPRRRGRAARDRRARPAPWSRSRTAPATTSCVPGQRAVIARGGAGGRGNKQLRRRRRGRRRASAERGLPGRARAGSSCSSSCSPTSGSSGCRTPASPRCWPGSPAPGRRSATTRSRRSSRSSARSRPRSASSSSPTSPGSSRARARAPASATSSSPTSSARGCSSTCSTSRRWTAPTRSTTTRRSRPSSPPTTRGWPRCRASSRSRRPTSSTQDAAAAAVAAWRERLGEDVPVLVTCAATGLGARRAGRASSAGGCRRGRAASPPPEAPASTTLAEHRVFRPGAGAASTSRRVGARRFRVSGPAAERLVARYDLDNEEALAHLERRLKRLGVIARARGRGLRARRRRRDRRGRVRARPGAARMSAGRRLRTGPVVVKLGSSVVADDAGAMRRPDASRRICDEVAPAAPRRAATSSSSPRGRSPAACASSGWTPRPRAIDELQAASAVGQGRLYQRLRRAAARARRGLGPGPADVLRHERAHALPQRAPDAAAAARTGASSR